jgi:hypothetical protein
MFPSSDRVFRRLAEDARQSERNRIAALNKIERPSLSMLRRLLLAGSPPRLRFRAGELYEIAIARRDLSIAARKDVSNNATK